MFRSWSPIKSFALRTLALLEVSELFYDLLPKDGGGAQGTAADRRDLDQALTMAHSFLPFMVLLALLVLILREWRGVDTLISVLGLGVAFFDAWLQEGTAGFAEMVLIMGVLIIVMFAMRGPVRFLGLFWRLVRW